MQSVTVKGSNKKTYKIRELSPYRVYRLVKCQSQHEIGKFDGCIVVRTYSDDANCIKILPLWNPMIVWGFKFNEEALDFEQLETGSEVILVTE